MARREKETQRFTKIEAGITNLFLMQVKEATRKGHGKGRKRDLKLHASRGNDPPREHQPDAQAATPTYITEGELQG